MDKSVDDYNERFSQLARVADTARTRVPIPRTEKFSRAEVVHAITGVFEMIGGLPRFALWAHENPTEYYRIYAKLLPSQQQVTVAHEHSGEVRLLSDRELTDIVHEEKTGGRTYDHENEAESGDL